VAGVATRFVLCRDDRFFSPAFLRGVVREGWGEHVDHHEMGAQPPGARVVGGHDVEAGLSGVGRGRCAAPRAGLSHAAL
jgi:hypothetical protein